MRSILDEEKFSNIEAEHDFLINRFNSLRQQYGDSQAVPESVVDEINKIKPRISQLQKQGLDFKMRQDAGGADYYPNELYKGYKRLAGEAEARLTQARMNMTPAERAASYPPSMFDVPVDQQIVRFGDGPAMSTNNQLLVNALRKPTAGELAQKLAHDRAMLPVSEHGLGLPAGNTAMDRAGAMGFDTPAYHGRVKDDLINNEIPQAIRGGSVGPAYLTDSPSVSSSYAMTSTPTNSSQNIKLAESIKGYSPTNYPLLVRSGRQLSNEHDIYDIVTPAELADDLSQYTSKLDYREFDDEATLKKLSNDVLDNFTPEYSGSSMPKNLSRLFGYLEEAPQYKPDLHNKFDSLIYNDLEAGGNTIVPFHKSDIRSRFAAFDPWRRNAAIAALTGTAAPDLMAGENDKLVNALRSK
jgi:hypothetical protein